MCVQDMVDTSNACMSALDELHGAPREALDVLRQARPRAGHVGLHAPLARGAEGRPGLREAEGVQPRAEHGGARRRGGSLKRGFGGNVIFKSDL